jgi:hypothetical protein
MTPSHRNDPRPPRLQRVALAAPPDDERWPPGWGLLAAVVVSIGAWIILLSAGAALARVFMR